MKHKYSFVLVSLLVMAMFSIPTYAQIASCNENQTYLGCQGTPSACSTYNSQFLCQDGGCNWNTGKGISHTIWSEDFNAGNPPADWSPWANDGNGLAHITNSSCASGACINADNGAILYNLSKQTNIDLSSCQNGTARFNIGKVAETGSLESDDCMYVWFSNDGGSTWLNRTTIFCDDGPASTFSTLIPNNFLQNDARIRIQKENFGASEEEGYLDNFNITCDIPVWINDFNSVSQTNDWSPWANDGNGISNSSSGNCASGRCMNGDGGAINYNISKQSNIDLSSCQAGTAIFRIGKVAETGDNEADDCMFVWFSNDAGATWLNRTQIFCNDSPPSNFSIAIPNSFLQNDMRLRIEKQNFGGDAEEAYLDDFSIFCKISNNCSGSPNSCSVFNSSQNSCLTHGCSPICQQQICGNGVIEGNEQCDDGNANNNDGCTNQCILTFCGDGAIQNPNANQQVEQCELPNTNNNQFCGQNTSQCLGPKLGTRDAFGSCSNVCGCVYDPFVYSCIQGQCGAQCDSNLDCPASQCAVTYNDTCVGPKLQEFDNDKVLDSTLVQNSVANTCDLANTCGCSNNPVSCNAPPTNTYCVQGVCGATCDANADCGPKLTNNTCFYSGTCDLQGACACNYQQEFCPAPGTKVGDTCYFGAQQCVGGGCTLDTCTLGDEDVCDPNAGCRLAACWTNATQGTLDPDAYLLARYVDLGLDTDGTGSSINPTDFRGGNYAFSGEKITYYVLVRDPHGASLITDARWVRGTGQPDDYESTDESLCDEFFLTPEEKEARTFVIDGKNISIPTTSNLNLDCQTDRIFKCTLEVETHWSGQNNIWVEASNVAGPINGTLPERWNFNPPLIVDVTTSDDEPLAFGNPILDQNAVYATSPNCINEPNDGSEDLTYRDCRDYVACENGEVYGCSERDAEKLCDISFSTNKIIVTNVGEVNLWTFIASEDFHATEGAAKCPFDNTLSANQFEYRATSGSYDSGWRMMPEYSPNLQCAGIGVGDSSNPISSDSGQCRGGCRIPAGGPGNSDGGAQTNPPLPGLDILSPTHTIEVALKLVWPTPCTGMFDNGNIHMLVRAV